MQKDKRLSIVSIRFGSPILKNREKQRKEEIPDNSY